MALADILAQLIGQQQPGGLLGMPAPGLLSDPQSAMGNPQAQAFMAAQPSQAPQGFTGARSAAPASQGQQMPSREPQAAPAGNGGGMGGFLGNLLNPGAKQRTATVQWLMRDGLDEGTATFLASDREGMRSYIMSRSKGKQPIEVNGRLVDPSTYEVIADFSDRDIDEARYNLERNKFAEERNQFGQTHGLERDKFSYERQKDDRSFGFEREKFDHTRGADDRRLKVEEKNAITTNDIREYQFARQNGFTGTFPEWKAQNSATTRETDDMREYNRAVEQGFSGTFMDYQIKMKEAGRNQVNIDTGVKLPPGYRWTNPGDPNSDVEPIPGGPAQQMPSELAARIGLAKDALTKLDRVEKAAREGKLTGPFDWAKGKIGRGEQGELGRELAAGAEALTRMLTGAGMNLAEVQREVQMYLPAPQDDAATLANKVSQLKRRLQSTIEMAGRGRGLEAPAPSQENEGWTDLGNGVRIRRKN